MSLLGQMPWLLPFTFITPILPLLGLAVHVEAIGVTVAAVGDDSDWRAVVGNRCRERDLFLRQVDSINELNAGFNPVDLWPSSRLARWLSSAVRRVEECRETAFRILDGIIKEHLERLDNGAGGADEAEDLLDLLLKIQREGGLPIPLDMDVIKCVVLVSIFLTLARFHAHRT